MTDMTDTPSLDPLELSRQIAAHPQASASLAGPKPAPSRSLWSMLSFKVKTLLLGALAVTAIGAAPPGSLSLLGPNLAAAEAGLSKTFGFAGPLSEAPNAAPGAAMSLASARSPSADFKGAVGEARPLSPNAATASAHSAHSVNAVNAVNAQPQPAAKSAPAPREPEAIETHPLARDVAARANRSLSSAVSDALPNGGAGMSSSQIALKLLKVDPTLALATAIENVEHGVYYDPGGTNIGMGYCVTKRVAEYGRERVTADLMGAGLSKKEAQALLSGNRKAHKGIELTSAGTLRLLEITKPDYQRLAEEAYGKEAFDKLPSNRQAVLTYIAYNTGNVAQFKSLISAAHKGDHVKAMSNLAMRWKDHDGSWQTNNRSRAWLQAAWLGNDHLADALSNPMAFESDVAAPHKESVIASLAKPGAIRDKLVAKRSQASAWAFKALGRERSKANEAPKAPGA